VIAPRATATGNGPLSAIPPKFLCDAMLARLGRFLRAAGGGGATGHGT